MSSRPLEPLTEDAVSALKVKTVSILTLEISGNDLAKIEKQLQEKVKQGPDFFRNAPLLLDFEYFTENINLSWLTELNRMIAAHHFVPVGISGTSASLADIAKMKGLAIWPSKRCSQLPQKQQEKPAKTAIDPPPTNNHSLTRIVQQPVRSGQRIYAEGGDLIVMTSVNTGAEIMADGHIHVYGCLRGKAFAGVKGREDARIFCHDLQADLVAIAGYYTIHEDIPENRLNSAVQISLRQESLNIELLNP